MADRLRGATSPYLAQHADNPVDWYPWGDEAFDDARRRDVPVFLSVGYSACHWCHVMAHESFENPHVAAIMNDLFVNIKVDREELPAVDARYMQATQALTGMGGWPMSVWLDHDRRAWFAGTYFPPVPSHGSPSFVQVLSAVSEAWRDERESVLSAAMRVHDSLRALQPAVTHEGARDLDPVLARAVDRLAAEFDPVAGGFGGAPKFPPAMVVLFLLRYAAYLSLNDKPEDPRIAVMVETTLERMAAGGLHDQLAGGFARYSVDASWVVPHFEKMLYDNALLVTAYTEWYAASGSAIAERVVEAGIGFLLSDMRTAHGAFASALDADSVDALDGQSREGAYYAWTWDEVVECAGAAAAGIFGVTPEGTFEHGRSVLQLPHGAVGGWDEARRALLERRVRRPAPGRDDKVVTAWNALTILALVRAAGVFGRPEWLEAAVVAADHLVSTHIDERGRLYRVSRDGRVAAHAPAVLEDYAGLARALLALHMATGDQAWLTLATALLADIRADFSTSTGDEVTLCDTSQVVRTALGLPDPHVDPTDNVTPSGWALAVDAALTFSSLTNDTGVRAWAEAAAATLAPLAGDHPRYAGWGASVLVAMADGPREVGVSADTESAMADVVRRMTAPGAVYTFDADAPLLAGRPTVEGAVHVCRAFVCDAPTTDIATARRVLGSR